MTELKKVEREARKKIVKNGGKHPSGSPAIPYISREKGDRGLHSIKEEYKVMKIKAVEKLYRNGDPAMVMVCESEKRVEK